MNGAKEFMRLIQKYLAMVIGGVLLLFGCVGPNSETLASTESEPNKAAGPLAIEQRKWDITSNFTPSGYCILKIEHDPSDIGDAWIYKLEGSSLRPVYRFATNINASLDLDSIYEFGGYLDILFCYDAYKTQMFRYDLRAHTLLSSIKTTLPLPMNPTFPRGYSDDSVAMMSDEGALWISKTDPEDFSSSSSRIILITPLGERTHVVPYNIFSAAVINGDTLLITRSGSDGRTPEASIKVKKLLEKNTVLQFEDVSIEFPSP